MLFSTISVALKRTVFVKRNFIDITCRCRGKQFPEVFYQCRGSLSTENEKREEITVALQGIPEKNIRNFCIVAHVDHGKSTLSDRILELTGTISQNTDNKQVLDKLQVERERGITVKAQTASMIYTLNGQQYLLNLIDTPGHVDFNYEVSRSLTACQGVLLLVDANQGIQAQTVANYTLALCRSLEIIPVINKIDLKNANPKLVTEQMCKLFDIQNTDILQVSAKYGTGCENLLHEIIKRIPPPSGSLQKPFRSLLFDSWYDKFRGALIMVAIIDGSVKVGDEVFSSTSKIAYTVREVGILSPNEKKSSILKAGQVGYLCLNMKSTKEAKIGDTLHHKDVCVEELPTVPPAKPMVFAGFYPADQSQIQMLRESIEKLTLNDSSVHVQMDSSPALGQGWRLGFLGLLHLEVFSQRLDQEFNVQVVVTAPNVSYKVWTIVDDYLLLDFGGFVLGQLGSKLIKSKRLKTHEGDELLITNPVLFPDPNTVETFLEPMVLGTVITPSKYIEKITFLSLERRGEERPMHKIDENHVLLQFKFPLNEVVVDFFDDLKSVSSGYASFDYEDVGYEPTEIRKLEFLLNGQIVEELSMIVHESRLQTVARKVCLKLRESIPKQQYEVAVQAVLGKRVIARETVKALRKDVTAKLYGGDVTRRKKLLTRQAEGKKRMRLIGKIQVPRDAFINVLKK